MPSRIDTLTYAGFGLLGGGTIGEMSKESAKYPLECPPLPEMPVKGVVNRMDINLLFGYIPGLEINLTGVIAILGGVMMVLAARRGKKQQRQREERDRIK